MAAKAKNKIKDLQKQLEQTELQDIPIDKIILDEELVEQNCGRSEVIDPQRLEELKADILYDGEVLEPVYLMPHPTMEGYYYPYCGNHRCTASRDLFDEGHSQFDTVPAYIIDPEVHFPKGTVCEVKLPSIMDNAKGGKAMTRKDFCGALARVVRSIFADKSKLKNEIKQGEVPKSWKKAKNHWDLLAEDIEEWLEKHTEAPESDFRAHLQSVSETIQHELSGENPGHVTTAVSPLPTTPGQKRKSTDVQKIELFNNAPNKPFEILINGDNFSQAGNSKQGKWANNLYQANHSDAKIYQTDSGKKVKVFLSDTLVNASNQLCNKVIKELNNPIQGKKFYDSPSNGGEGAEILLIVNDKDFRPGPDETIQQRRKRIANKIREWDRCWFYKKKLAIQVVFLKFYEKEEGPELLDEDSNTWVMPTHW